MRHIDRRKPRIIQPPGSSVAMNGENNDIEQEMTKKNALIKGQKGGE